MDIPADTNLGIEDCVNGTPERNAIILCTQVDYSFKYKGLPRPYQLFDHLTDCQSNCIIRE